MKSKISTLSELSKLLLKLKKKEKSVGLITGCFDILHVGHIDLFRFAKEHVDILVVGVDNDKSIELSKGRNRPVIPLKYRMELLSELSLIDYVFPINSRFNFEDRAHKNIMYDVYKIINPSAIFSEKTKDKYILNKSVYARELKIRLIMQKRSRIVPSSTEIISYFKKL